MDYFPPPEESTEYRLQQRLYRLCDEAEALAKGEDGEQLKTMVLTKQIRQILEDNT